MHWFGLSCSFTYSRMAVDHSISPPWSLLKRSITKGYLRFPAPADSEMILEYCQKRRSRTVWTAEGGIATSPP